jgi:hypothetical protein
MSCLVYILGLSLHRIAIPSLFDPFRCLVPCKVAMKHSALDVTPYTPRRILWGSCDDLFSPRHLSREYRTVAPVFEAFRLIPTVVSWSKDLYRGIVLKVSENQVCRVPLARAIVQLSTSSAPPQSIKVQSTPDTISRLRTCGTLI